MRPEGHDVKMDTKAEQEGEMKIEVRKHDQEDGKHALIIKLEDFFADFICSRYKHCQGNYGEFTIYDMTLDDIRQLGWEILKLAAETVFECPCGTTFKADDGEFKNGYLVCPSCGCEDLVGVK